ncbi:MAG: hypothetical protein LQ339_007076 [Xanthoria mediterranea]|nr:MAG: hypothetical protein LQ339_007076 [Xanthoria mediterranea]
MGRVESYLDETVAERLDNEVDDDDSDRRGREGVNREVAHRGAEVTVEIHPPRNMVTIPVDDGVDDEKDSHPVGSLVSKNPKRRRMPVRGCRVTKAGGAFSNLDESNDDSDPDMINVRRRPNVWSECNSDGEPQDTQRQSKRRRRHDRDELQLQLQLGQSHVTDSTANSEDGSATGSEVPTSRGSRTPAYKEYQPVTTTARRPKKRTGIVRSYRLLGLRRRAQRRPNENNHIPQRPASMMRISPTDSPGGMTPEKAIKMVAGRVKARDHLAEFATFFASLFSPDTIARLLLGCQEYAKVIATSSGRHDIASDRGQMTQVVAAMEEQGIPEQARKLVVAYIATDTQETTFGTSVGNAMHYHRQVVFARELKNAYDQIANERGEVWDFILEWVSGPAGRNIGKPLETEINRFIMEQACGRSKQQMALEEWIQLSSRFAMVRKQGENLSVLSDICTPAVYLLVATTATRGVSPSRTLFLRYKMGTLEGFVGQVFELHPEYSLCFEEMNERLWKPILDRRPLPWIRLLSLDTSTRFEDEVHTELLGKSMREWLEFDDDAVAD